jgi:WD40 repeat protein
MVRTIGVTPDASTALVAVFAHGVTAWRLPAGELALGLSPMPGADEHPDHDHPVDALAIRPDGGEVAVSATARILRYSLASGEQTADLPGGAYAVRALAWSDDGKRLFASTFHDGVVRVLGPDDAIESSRLAIDRHLVAFALAPAGDLAVLASEEGPLTVFDVASGEPKRRLPSPVAAPLLAFAGRYLVAGRQDGVIDVWDPTTGARAGGMDTRPPPLALAVRPGDGLLASAGDDGVIRLHSIPGSEPRDMLVWHDRPVQALAFAGSILLSGDSAGGLALWDVPEPPGGARKSFTADEPQD